ncbi:MAG TPA: glucose 1-dehydrogenase [Solirubrobacteraceae bacterium]|nr:glucose 1-dehydrogenase [Solirubrobacteraceae bacterium]
MSTIMEGRAGLVTGAAGGIGRATAIAFAREGAAVVVSDLESRAADGEETVRLIEQAGGRATFVAADVRRASDHEALVRAVRDAYGRFDFAHNNAGVEQQHTIAETTEEEWDLICEVNLKGVFLALKAQLPAMTEQGHGAIVNTASLAGLIGAPALGPYVASKHGVVGLTKTAAIEAAPAGVRVNAVCPAAIATAMILGLEPERQAELASPQALKRIGQPSEVAEAVVWLASERASFVTGTAMAVDAGSTAGIVLPGEIAGLGA